MTASLWLDEAAPFAGAELPRAAEVAVVGGGIAGVSTALALARRGVDVALLERGAIACRASGRGEGGTVRGIGRDKRAI